MAAVSGKPERGDQRAAAMKHGEEIAYWEGSSDPDLWFGLATPISLYLAWEREFCKCQARCECDDWKEAPPGGS